MFRRVVSLLLKRLLSLLGIEVQSLIVGGSRDGLVLQGLVAQCRHLSLDLLLHSLFIGEVRVKASWRQLLQQLVLHRDGSRIERAVSGFVSTAQRSSPSSKRGNGRGGANAIQPLLLRRLLTFFSRSVFFSIRDVHFRLEDPTGRACAAAANARYPQHRSDQKRQQQQRLCWRERREAAKGPPDCADVVRPLQCGFVIASFSANPSATPPPLPDASDAGTASAAGDGSVESLSVAVGSGSCRRRRLSATCSTANRAKARTPVEASSSGLHRTSKGTEDASPLGDPIWRQHSFPPSFPRHPEKHPLKLPQAAETLVEDAAAAAARTLEAAAEMMRTERQQLPKSEAEELSSCLSDSDVERAAEAVKAAARRTSGYILEEEDRIAREFGGGVSLGGESLEYLGSSACSTDEALGSALFSQSRQSSRTLQSEAALGLVGLHEVELCGLSAYWRSDEWRLTTRQQLHPNSAAFAAEFKQQHEEHPDASLLLASLELSASIHWTLRLPQDAAAALPPAAAVDTPAAGSGGVLRGICSSFDLRQPQQEYQLSVTFEASLSPLHLLLRETDILDAAALVGWLREVQQHSSVPLPASSAREPLRAAAAVAAAASPAADGEGAYKLQPPALVELRQRETSEALGIGDSREFSISLAALGGRLSGSELRVSLQTVAADAAAEDFAMRLGGMDLVMRLERTAALAAGLAEAVASSGMSQTSAVAGSVETPDRAEAHSLCKSEVPMEGGRSLVLSYLSFAVCSLNMQSSGTPGALSLCLPRELFKDAASSGASSPPSLSPSTPPTSSRASPRAHAFLDFLSEERGGTLTPSLHLRLHRGSHADLYDEQKASATLPSSRHEAATSPGPKRAAGEGSKPRQRRDIGGQRTQQQSEDFSSRVSLRIAPATLCGDVCLLSASVRRMQPFLKALQYAKGPPAGEGPLGGSPRLGSKGPLWLRQGQQPPRVCVEVVFEAFSACLYAAKPALGSGQQSAAAAVEGAFGSGRCSRSFRARQRSSFSRMAAFSRASPSLSGGALRISCGRTQFRFTPRQPPRICCRDAWRHPREGSSNCCCSGCSDCVAATPVTGPAKSSGLPDFVHPSGSFSWGGPDRCSPVGDGGQGGCSSCPTSNGSSSPDTEDIFLSLTRGSLGSNGEAPDGSSGWIPVLMPVSGEAAVALLRRSDAVAADFLARRLSAGAPSSAPSVQQGPLCASVSVAVKPMALLLGPLRVSACAAFAAACHLLLLQEQERQKSGALRRKATRGGNSLTADDSSLLKKQSYSGLGCPEGSLYPEGSKRGLPQAAEQPSPPSSDDAMSSSSGRTLSCDCSSSRSSRECFFDAFDPIEYGVQAGGKGPHPLARALAGACPPMAYDFEKETDSPEEKQFAAPLESYRRRLLPPLLGGLEAWLQEVSVSLRLSQLCCLVSCPPQKSTAWGALGGPRSLLLRAESVALCRPLGREAVGFTHTLDLRQLEGNFRLSLPQQHDEQQEEPPAVCLQTGRLALLSASVWESGGGPRCNEFVVPLRKECAAVEAAKGAVGVSPERAAASDGLRERGGAAFQGGSNCSNCSCSSAYWCHPSGGGSRCSLVDLVGAVPQQLDANVSGADKRLGEHGSHQCAVV
ncbi:hypothetical protein cyc_05151 [Cyclospora cayetanensis]|uniref:Chorein N-terminal domain-containing protein n=1 Tax=Cyclospora cayetanensis TaxID=88456 RepID=A0A1D3D2A8_9EIME|nr:hypothetical protein cyc_05151 [Cyclospora cayetanensis]